MKTKTKKNGKARASGKTVSAKGALIPLKKICADLGIEPKRARVKLRRAWRADDEDSSLHASKGARWDLTAKQAARVRAILSA
jgi:hypothetical protein